MSAGPPLLADANLLGLDIVRAAVDEGVTVVDRLMADRAAYYPLVRIHRWGGAAVHPQFLDRAIFDVTVFHDDIDAATTLAGAIRSALFLAADRQTIYPHGSVASFREILAPMEPETPIRLDGETLVQATYELWLCPPLTIP